MTLRARLYLLISFLILGSTAVVYLSARHVIDGGFSAIEAETLHSQMDTARSALAGQLAEVQSLALDNAHWDDAYSFVTGANPSFITRNYQPEFLRQINVDAFVVVDANGKVLASVTSNAGGGQMATPPQDVMDRLRSSGLLSPTAGPSSRKSGIISVGTRKYLGAASSVVHSDGSGPAVGRIIFLRAISDDIIAKLAHLTHHRQRIYSLEEATRNPRLLSVRRRLGDDQEAEVVEFVGDDSATAFALLADPAGNPSGILELNATRPVHNQAQLSTLYLTVWTLVFAVLFGVVALALWNRTVFRRLASLGREITSLRSGNTNARVSTSGGDEIAAIAQVLNSTLDQLQASERELLNERERLIVTLTSIGDAVIATDERQRVTFINNVAQSLSGWSSEEAVGRDVSEVLILINEETRQPVPNPITEALESNSSTLMPEGTLLVRRDGSEVPVDDSAAPIRTHDGTLVGSVIVFRDVSERREAMAKVCESETRLKTIWQSIHTGVVIIDAQTNEIVDANDVAAGMIGRRKREVIGRKCHDFLCPNNEGKCPMPDNVSIMECGECVMRTASGDPMDVLKTLTRIELGGRPCIVETFADISDRKRAEEALIETSEELERSLARNRAILETSAVGILVADGTGRVTEANGRAASIFNCALSELLGSDSCKLFASEEEYHEFDDLVAPRLASGENVLADRQLIRCDGTLVWCELWGKSIDPGNPDTGTVWMVLDITERKKALEALETTQFAVDHASDCVFWVDSNANFQYVNEAASILLGYTREELMQMSVFDIDPAFDKNRWPEHWKKLSETRYSNMITKHKAKDGRVYPVELCTNYHEFGETKQLVTFARDITTRVQNEAKMRMQVSAINTASDHVLIFDTDARIVFANKAIQEHTGYAENELIGQLPAFLAADISDDAPRNELWETIGRGSSWTGEIRNRKKSGEAYYCEVSVTPVVSDSGEPEYYIGIGRDVTNRKTHEKMLDRQAKHDTLTGLPNRLVFNETLTAMVKGHRKSEAMLGVMFLDLDKFKSINDTLGHDAGDLLLIEASERLRQCLRDTDVLCRMGGDEFTIILRQLTQVEDARVVADRILETMRRTFTIKGHEFNIGASIGVSIYPRDAKDFTGIVRNADSAMYRAKELGRNNCQFYSDTMDAENDERVRMERDLQMALQNGELEVYYQPRVDPMTATLVGAESLLRWNHPTRGLVPASEFIPLAEENGQILAIGEYVIDAVCAQLAKWMGEGRQQIQVAVNLSEKHAFRNDFLSSISERLARHNLPPSSISLELPGKAFLHISEQALQAIESLRQEGVQLTLDDFSSGPLPLTVLNRIPVDILKLDSSLVASSINNIGDSRLLASVAGTARNLGMQVVAVGVETRQHLELAGSIMCDAVQGYLISPPLPIDAFEKFMLRGTYEDLSQGEAA